jgi:hypothetical protein
MRRDVCGFLRHAFRIHETCKPESSTTVDVPLRERLALSLAIQDAARQLAHPRRQGLLDEFSDASGRALRAGLEAQTPAEYLDRLFFYDARPAACEGGRLAMTTPGSRVILVCSRRLARSMKVNRRYIEAIIIHEMLHSLGLGENPPSSDYITSRVLASCGQTGEVPSIVKTAQTHPATSAAAVSYVAVAIDEIQDWTRPSSLSVE